jgi:hypothetical protein
MSFRIADLYDQGYSCAGCDTRGLDRSAVNASTWSCLTCGERLWIAMSDPAGNSYLVERLPAKALVVGDQVVYQKPRGLEAGEVRASGPGKRKGKWWFLAVERFGSDHVEPERYINRAV